MNTNKIILVLVGFILLLTLQTNAQNFLSTQGKAIVNENQDTILLRGMGLGGWMLQEGYMLQTASFANPQHEIKEIIEELIGEADTELFYDAWLANHCRKSDIDSLKSWGFNSVRLPMHYNLFTLPIEDEPVAGEQTWLEKGFVLTDSLISWCRQNEMYVVLDMHAAPGGQGYDAAISDYDTNKPSLWESPANRTKMVALWQRLAERYADEEWVAGYDLLNEPNWDLPGGVALRNLYVDVTNAIREVDPDHIIFIEGNWFANDFTGLTPPWDDQLVYSPHKYWSINDEASMEFATDIRDTYNVPLYLGETGENSNVWFRDAVRLYEDLDMGWAWWPMKKIESISGPLSIIKTPEYQSLLDYWNGNGNAPSADFAKATLMQLTEDLKTENCVYQKDVIDALFRQVYSDETIPYNLQNIPGILYATDYDMGIIGAAYFDEDAANYQVSTGEFTAWNQGWAYRNDGVDIEFCQDDTNTNGFNVGFLNTDEWMQYSVEVAESGVYDIHVRAASGGSGGRLHFEANNADITGTSFVPPTGGWQNWETTIIPNIIINESDTQIKFYVDQAGFNISSFEFIPSETTPEEITTVFVDAVTVDEYTIQININKYMDIPTVTTISDFEITVDGTAIPITEIIVDIDNPRIIHFGVDAILNYANDIKISYVGNQILADDGTNLNTFTLEDVQNTLPFVHQIPTKIEAESFTFQTGIDLEPTTDTGGGQNIGYLDAGDYLDYEVNVTTAGIYEVSYRTAAQWGTGRIELQFIDQNGAVNTVNTPSFPSTGNWQSWTTTTQQVDLVAGRYTMRIVVIQAPINMNWIEFSLSTSTNDPLESAFTNINIFPNPSGGIFNIQAQLQQPQAVHLEIVNLNGQIIQVKNLDKVTSIQEVIALENAPNGFYFLVIRLEDGSRFSQKLVKMGE